MSVASSAAAAAAASALASHPALQVCLLAVYPYASADKLHHLPSNATLLPQSRWIACGGQTVLSVAPGTGPLTTTAHYKSLRLQIKQPGEERARRPSRRRSKRKQPEPDSSSSSISEAQIPAARLPSRDAPPAQEQPRTAAPAAQPAGIAGPIQKPTIAQPAAAGDNRENHRAIEYPSQVGHRSGLTCILPNHSGGQSLRRASIHT